jgi:hypothetical protein
MATSTVVATSTATVETKKTIGTDESNDVLVQLAEFMESIDTVAMEALKGGDRKGVLLSMRVSGALERCKKSITKSVERANKVRGKKVGADEVELADIDIDDDDDDE